MKKAVIIDGRIVMARRLGRGPVVLPRRRRLWQHRAGSRAKAGTVDHYGIFRLKTFLADLAYRMED